MSKITALKQVKNRQNRVHLYLDGKFTGSLETAQVKRQGLTIGAEFSGEQLEALLLSLQTARCLNAAYRLLSYRPRSEAELKERLQKRGFTETQIEPVLEKLKEQRLIDDAKFAEFWQENRQAFSPRSRWLTGRELTQKGVSAEIAKAAVQHIDEDEAAYEIAGRRASHLAAADYEEFRRKIGGVLQRRGFGYSVINRTLNRVWDEIKKKG